MRTYTTETGRTLTRGDILYDKRRRAADAVRIDNLTSRTLHGKRTYHAQVTLFDRTDAGTFVVTGTRKFQVTTLTTWAFVPAGEAFPTAPAAPDGRDSLRHGAIVSDTNTFQDRSGYQDPWDGYRAFMGIPPGFPLWYVPERLALTVGPIGRLIQSTQCQCGHDELRHIRILDECLAGCDCRRFVLRMQVEARPGWRERLGKLVRTVVR